VQPSSNTWGTVLKLNPNKSIYISTKIYFYYYILSYNHNFSNLFKCLGYDTYLELEICCFIYKKKYRI